MSLLSRLANVFRPDRLTRDIDEELASHLEEAVAHGRDPVESRRALGPSLRLREQSRDSRLIPWLDSLRADTVFAWRQLNKRRITSLAAILSLALAIGSCTSAFRIIDALFLRPLPIAHPDRLYVFHPVGADGKTDVMLDCNYPLFREMSAAVGEDATLLAISYSSPWTVTYGSEQELEQANGEYVSGRMFTAFGLRPAAGRLLSADDDAPGRAYAVLSFDYWTRRFGRDPNAIGRTFRFGRDLYTIAGVADQDFTGIEPGIMNDLFVPAMMNPMADSEAAWLRTLVVVEPGISPERVRQQMQPALHAYWQEHEKAPSDLPPGVIEAIVNQRVLLEPARSGISDMQSHYRQPLLSLSLLVALVLLIACANVANLKTAQAAARAREMALRVSIGAGRARLIQLVLAEAALLALFSAGAGVPFSAWSAPFVVARINPPDHPARLFLPADWRVLAFTLALTVAIAFLLALAPALRAAHTVPADALKDRSSKSGGSRHALVAAQAAFCVLVLFVAGLFVATLQRLSHQPLGFSPDRLLALEVQGPHLVEPPSVWNHVLETLQSAPGVEQAARVDGALLSGNAWGMYVAPSGRPFGRDTANFLSVSPGWFQTMKIPLLAGRDFRLDEAYPAPVAIVNRAFAELLFKGDDVLGKVFEMPGGSELQSRSKFTIVGLVENAQYASLRDPMPPAAYVPLGSTLGRTIMVRTTSQNALALAPTLRQAISSAEPQMRLNSVHTQQELIDNQTLQERLLATLALFFAAVALLLAAVGLYSVLDYSVFQRRREIGIRMAVGARPVHIIRGVILGVIAWVLAGSAVGLALGLASVHYIESLLYQVKATSTSSLALPALALFTAAILAAFPPILRALHVDPVETLRSE